MTFTVQSNRIHHTTPEGQILAEVTFPESSPGVVNINRIFVDESLRGLGVAGQLMEAVVHTLSADGRKARAICSYAVQWFEKHPEDAARILSGG